VARRGDWQRFSAAIAKGVTNMCAPPGQHTAVAGQFAFALRVWPRVAREAVRMDT
jgi:hypothetical protein